MKSNGENAHSPIGASSMYRWSVCPGSVTLSESVIPTSTSVYAEVGLEAHDWLAKVLTGLASLNSIPEKDGMRDSVTYAFDVIREQIARAGKEGRYWVEHGFDLSHIFPGCHGTADVVIYNPIKKLLIVIDYKHGAGILVDVEENLQLQYYGLGALTTLKEIGDIETVKLQVIQPRIDHADGYTRSWNIDSLDLFDFAIDLQKFAKATTEKNAPLVPGEHCRFCVAAAICPKLKEFDEVLESGESEETRTPPSVSKKTCSAVVTQSGNSQTQVNVPQTTEQLAKALKWIPTLQSWIKSVTEYCYQKANSGETIPGYKLVEKRATRKWIDTEKVVEFLEEYDFKEDEIYEPLKIKSPAQLEKLIPKQEWHVLDPYISKKSTGLTLVVESDKRPSVKSLAEVEFEKIESN